MQTSKSELLWLRKATQVAPQQADIDKIADYKDREGRTYAIWKPKNAVTGYLDDTVQEQLKTEQKGAVAIFVAKHKADSLPYATDKIRLSRWHKQGKPKDVEPEKELQFTVLNVLTAAPGYPRARKSALLIAKA